MEDGWYILGNGEEKQVVKTLRNCDLRKRHLVLKRRPKSSDSAILAYVDRLDCISWEIRGQESILHKCTSISRECTFSICVPEGHAK